MQLFAGSVVIVLWVLTLVSIYQFLPVLRQGNEDHQDTHETHQFGPLSLGFLQPYVYENGLQCGVDTGCLSFVRKEEISDTDILGHYKENRHTYMTAHSKTSVSFSSRIYDDNYTVVFKQEFPNGLQGTSMGDKDGVSTAFPRVILPDGKASPGVRFFTPGGIMIGWTNLSIGSIEKDLEDFRYGEDGGLVVLFQAMGSQQGVWSLAMSSLTEAMATNVWLDRDSFVLDWGIQGQAEGIPAGFKVEVIFHFHPSSINALVMEWGSKLKTYHSTTKIDDPSSNYLNYYTDNGAYYYYNTGDYDNYMDAMMSVHNYSLDFGLPIRYLELDSWWYFKGLEDGLKNWTEIPSAMPGGIINLHQDTGWPIVAHNRYFASDTDYAQQNGGPYPFTLDNSTQKALPLDKSFWDGLFDEGKKWGLVTYIQDWLNVQYSETSALHTNLTLGKSWLDYMGQSARERNISIMYCMSYVRHILHSVRLPAVTQARASDDFNNNDRQWRIGVTSLIAHALGLLPFKDVFRSTEVNHPHLQSAVGTLCGGTVGPGDRAEDLDIDLLMKSCNQDGLLLHPTKPLTVIDKYFLSDDYREVWTGYTVIGDYTFGNIFLEDIKYDLTLTAFDLNLEAALENDAILWQNYPLDSTYLREVRPGEAVDLPSCEGAFNFCLYYTSPVLKTDTGVFYLLGEKEKWVPVSSQRVNDIRVSRTDVIVTLRGVVEEDVVFSIYDTSSVFDIKCNFLEDGTMEISLNSKTCH